MSWQPIAHGAHVNWAQPDPLDGLDPYLVWADGTDFAPYGGLTPPGKIATLIELKDGKTVADLEALGLGLLDARVARFAALGVVGDDQRQRLRSGLPHGHRHS